MSLSALPFTEKTALVVDDIESVRYYHTYILRHMGFRCEIATNGDDALKLLQHTPIHFAIIDILMPKMNGVQLIQKIRTLPAYTHLPILVISSESIKDQVETLPAPISFARKPILPVHVMQQIQHLLNAA